MAYIRTWRRAGREYRAICKSVWNRQKKRSEQQVIKWLGRSPDQESDQPFDLSMSLREDAEAFLFQAAQRRRSMLIHGEWGIGKSFLAKRLTLLLKDAGMNAHYEPWSSPAGPFIAAIADALDIDTCDDDGKRKTQAVILAECGPELVHSRTVLIIDKAHAIPATLRNAIEQWLENGATIFLFGTTPRRADTWLKFPRWELRPLDAIATAKLIGAASEHYQVKLSGDRARELATTTNGNPQYAIRAVLEHDIGTETPNDQTEWIDGTPLVIAALAGLIIIRYLGQGTGDRNLIVMGGIATVLIRILSLWFGRMSRKDSKI